MLPGQASTAQEASSHPTAVQSASPSSGFSTASATPLPSSYSAGSFPNTNLLYIQWSVTLGSRMLPGRHLCDSFPQHQRQCSASKFQREGFSKFCQHSATAPCLSFSLSQPCPVHQHLNLSLEVEGAFLRHSVLEVVAVPYS